MEQDTKSTALLVMDMQAAVVGLVPGAPEITSKVAKAITHARAQGIPVIYVVVGFRPGMPEVSEQNKIFGASKKRAADMKVSVPMHIDESVQPLESEIIITKRRMSAFTGSDLDVVLRALGCRHLVLTGIATSGVVLSTLREAADKDFHLTVLSDGCADPVQEVHDMLIARIFPPQAAVLSVEEWSATDPVKSH